MSDHSTRDSHETPMEEHDSFLLEEYKIGDVFEQTTGTPGEESDADEREVDAAQKVTKAPEFEGRSGRGKKLPVRCGVDYSKPLLPQIYKLDVEIYAELVRQPYITRETLVLFPQWWLEIASRTRWWIVPVIWLPFGLSLVWRNAVEFGVTGVLALGLFCLGIFGWTFFEYMYHRFLFHYSERLLPNHGGALVVHFCLHAVHHMLPMDALRLVMPPALFLILLSSVWFAFRLLGFPLWLLLGSFGGGVWGYVAYDMVHYASHHFRVDSIPYLRGMKKYHMNHHFLNPNFGYGVSVKFWDYVFGTVIPEYSTKQTQ